MPVSLKKIVNNTAEVTFTYCDDDITLTYYPGRITEKLFVDLSTFENMRTSEDAEEGFRVLNTTLMDLIKEWDIYEDDDMTVMFPLDAERVKKEIPLMLRVEAVYAIVHDFRPNQTASQTPN